jgi:HlyD family secretion protein
LLKRQEALAEDGIIPPRDYESARTGYQAAEARYNQAAAQVRQARAAEQSASGAGLAQAQAQVRQARAQVQQSEAALRLAEVNLSHTTIRSPIDGVVVSRNVDVGQTVAASLSAPTLFTIANDLTRMQVIANIDQADIGVINQSNRVNFTVDAFPGENFTGAIRQIRLNPQNVQNVVTYNAVIDVENPDLKLKPGMTANLTMTIAERRGVVKVPNAALRFRPTDAGARAGGPILEGQTQVVWALGPDGRPQSRRIQTGVTDGAATEVVGGELSEGEQVVVGRSVSAEGGSRAGQIPPGFGGGRRR